MSFLIRLFQDSAVQREREVFSCMIKNLFEEYKYFPQYPEKELHVTAQLFGGIIEHGLVTMVPLGLALRFVLDAVKVSRGLGGCTNHENRVYTLLDSSDKLCHNCQC